MAEGFLGGHREAYSAALVNRHGIKLRDLALVSGSLSWNMFRTIPGAGTVVIMEPAEPVDWSNQFVSVTYRAALGVQTIEKQMIVGVVVEFAPDTAAKTLSLELMDKLYLLTIDTITDSLSYDVGTVVVDTVIDMLQSAGEQVALITPSTEALSTVMNFPAGTTKLEVINELLRAINYTSLAVDGQGRFRANKETSTDSPPVHEFLPGQYSVASPDVADERNLSDIPNSVTVIATSDGEDEAMWATAQNTDPNNPYSIENRGYVFSRVVEGIEASSQEALEEIALEYLRSSSQITWRQTIKHLWVDINLRDIVVGHSGQTSNVVETSVTLAPGAMVSTVLRRFDNALDWKVDSEA